MSTWERGVGWGVVDRPTDGAHGGRLYAAPLATGEIIVLAGPSAVVARAAIAGHDASGVRATMAQVLGVDEDSVDGEGVAEVLDELVSMGMLRRT